jgi:hypothetical protein
MRSPARQLGGLAGATLAAVLGGVQLAAAADPTIAKVRPGKPGSPFLYVMFKTPVPAPADVRGKERWEVRVATAEALIPIAVLDAQEVPDDYAVTGLVTLTLATALPSDYKRVEVRYTLGNAPLGVLTTPKVPTSGIVPVDDPKKADVYLSGILLPAAEAKPVYTIDSRGSYQIWANSSGSRVWDVSGSAKADKRENADLDSYVFGANYHQIGRAGRPVNIHWFSGAEMNSKARVTNLVTAPRVARPWTRNVYRRDADGVTKLAATFGATLDGSVEGGWNLRNLYSDPEEDEVVVMAGSGGILRAAPGLTLYMVKPNAGFLGRIGVTARYVVRLLARDEIFLETRKSRGAGKDPIPQLNRRARHLTQITTAFMLTEFAGLELKYSYGSEPPAFKLADHNGAVGLVIKFRQTSRIR